MASKNKRQKPYVQIPKGSDSNEIMIYRNKGNMLAPEMLEMLR